MIESFSFSKVQTFRDSRLAEKSNFPQSENFICWIVVVLLVVASKEKFWRSQYFTVLSWDPVDRSLNWGLNSQQVTGPSWSALENICLLEDISQIFKLTENHMQTKFGFLDTLISPSWEPLLNHLLSGLTAKQFIFFLWPLNCATLSFDLRSHSFMLVS